MKTILILLISITLIGCSNIKNPRLSFGKKCLDRDGDVAYSYVWLYDKNVGLNATKKQCD
jgi:hypothetical protein